MVSISVIIPTYRRPSDLKKCLEALKLQHRYPDEVLVVVRDTDEKSRDFLVTFEPELLPLKVVDVEPPGQVAALNRGLAESKGDIVCFIDDDGVPYPHWLELIETHFLADDNVGGVGGKDWLYIGNKLVEGEQEIVGQVQWFGRAIGNHHLGVGQPGEVEVLKGANMSYRKAAVANRHFDDRLLGSGAEVHNDLAFALQTKKAGWKLIYDPAVEIDHYQGQRFDEDRRGKFNRVAWFNEVHNETLVILDYLPPLRQVIFLLWAFFVGSRKGYGIVQLLRFLPKEGKLAIDKFFLSLTARKEGCVTLLKTKNRDKNANLSPQNIMTASESKRDIQPVNK